MVGRDTYGHTKKENGKILWLFLGRAKFVRMLDVSCRCGSHAPLAPEKRPLSTHRWLGQVCGRVWPVLFTYREEIRVGGENKQEYSMPNRASASPTHSSRMSCSAGLRESTSAADCSTNLWSVTTTGAVRFFALARREFGAVCATSIRTLIRSLILAR